MSSSFIRHDPHDVSGPHDRSSFTIVELEIVRGRARHRIRPIEVPAFLIGTALDCDLVLGDPQFPEVHAYVLRDEGRVKLRWLGSDPELTINGRPVDIHPPTLLSHGDVIRTGPYEFKLHIRRLATPATIVARQVADMATGPTAISAALPTMAEPAMGVLASASAAMGASISGATASVGLAGASPSRPLRLYVESAILRQAPVAVPLGEQHGASR